jgi:hypothetical protein
VTTYRVDCWPSEDCLLLACDVAVRRALEVGSKRMLTRRHLADQSLRTVEPHLIYTRLPAVHETDAQDRILAGAWCSLPEPMLAIPELIPALDGYARSLLASGTDHAADYLWPVIRSVLDG